MEQVQFKLDAPWEEVKEKLKEHNYLLTDEDLEYVPGQEQDLLNRLEKKLGLPQNEVKALIESVSYNSGMAG
jgi:hypothetical protein